MKKYRSALLSFSKSFRDMNQQELQALYNWYVSVIPKRIQVLTEAVKGTSGYESWEPDFSPDSLELLGRWFAHTIKTRNRTREEKKEIYANAPEWFKHVKVSDETLTTQTLSLAFDIGMYVGQVFLKNNPRLRWFHELRRKDDIHYGYPVIAGFIKEICFNPTHMLRVYARKLMDKENKSTLKDLYTIWIEKYMELPDVRLNSRSDLDQGMFQKYVYTSRKRET